MGKMANGDDINKTPILYSNNLMIWKYRHNWFKIHHIQRTSTTIYSLKTLHQQEGDLTRTMKPLSHVQDFLLDECPSTQLPSLCHRWWSCWGQEAPAIYTEHMLIY